MLTGSIEYFDPELGWCRYKVHARDSFNDTKLYLIGDTGLFEQDKRNVECFDKHREPDGTVTYPFADSFVDTFRRLDVRHANKYKSNITNKEMCVCISATLQYVRITGHKEKSALPFGVEAEQFSEFRELVSDIPGCPQARVRYKLGLFDEVHIESPRVHIDLKTCSDSEVGEAIFKELKDKDKFGHVLSKTPISNVGFKLISENLGFEYRPKEAAQVPNVFGMYQTIEDVIEAHPDKSTDWINHRKYVIVNDDNLDEVWQMFMDYDGLIAFDTETSGLRMNFKSRTGEANQLAGCVLSMEKGTGYYFPCQHKLFDNVCGGDHWYFMERYMKPILEGKRIICHNIKFDWKVAYIYGINVNCVYDTMIALGVTKRYEEESFELGLKSLVKSIFGIDMLDLDDFVTGTFGESDVAFWDLPYDLVRRYAPADADWTLALYEFIEEQDILNRYGAKTVFELEVDFAKATAYSEFYGYHINVNKIPELQERILGAMDEHKQKMFAMAGHEFNPNSSVQLSKIMYDELGIEMVGNKRSTAKENLKTLSEMEDVDGNPRYPFVFELKAYRDNEGIYKNFLKKLHEFATTDGYIFPEVLQLGTNTGRCSVKNPNYQSYNDTVKQYVIPRPDYIHVDSDFAQIEYRVLASMARELTLIEAFNDPDLDYHSYQASRMFSVPYASVTKQLRQQSKGINFGLPYGMGDESLGTRIFGARNQENTRKAAELRAKFFQGQERIQMFFEAARSSGVANGYTATQFGRRRYYHRGKFTVNEIRRQAGNHVIQGTAADIYKMAVVNMFRRVCKEGWLGKVLFNTFVHDELLMEVHKSINPYYFTKVWREEFEVKIEGYCRLFAGLGYGNCWYDAKKLDLPPQYIDEIEAKGQENYDWDEDFANFLTEIKLHFEEYKINRIKNYIQDESSQNEPIKPVIGSLLGEKLPGLIEKVWEQNQMEQYNYDCDMHLPLSKPVKPADPNAFDYKQRLKEYEKLSKSCKVRDLQEQLRFFCRYFDIDYSAINIRSPEDVVVESGGERPVIDPNSINFEDMSDEEFRVFQLQTRGMLVDYAKKKVYLSELHFQNATTGQMDSVTHYFTERGFVGPGGEFAIVYYPQIMSHPDVIMEVPGLLALKEGIAPMLNTYVSLISQQLGVMV